MLESKSCIFPFNKLINIIVNNIIQHIISNMFFILILLLILSFIILFYPLTLFDIVSANIITLTNINIPVITPSESIPTSITLGPLPGVKY